MKPTHSAQQATDSQSSNQHGSAEICDHQEFPGPGRPSTRSRARLAVACTIMALLALTTWVFNQPQRRQTAEPASQAWRAEAARLGSALLVEHASEAEKTRARIAARFASADGDAQALSGQAAAPFLGFKNTARNVWMLAWDKVRGTRNFQAVAMASLRPAVEWEAKTAGSVSFDLEQLQETLAAADNRFRATVVAFGGTGGEASGRLELDEKSFSQMLAHQQQLTMEVAGASVAAALETALIGTTIQSVRTLAAAAIARLTGTVAAAGTSAVADGPLPIGDIVGAIIAVGGTVWTIWDIRNAARAMAQLQPKIQAQLRADLKRLEQSALARIDAMTAAHATVAHLK